ncbi:hypothetical protein J3458_020324 [Metarhizium acridum]|uniref:uncharacterized protein n=1 Tax=Metarhizium acridum TaxID=92637 RepID=UPI001C6BA9AD|nr:hypothetical protein J3458_020324 [Metarhizium acridum]
MQPVWPGTASGRWIFSNHTSPRKSTLAVFKRNGSGQPAQYFCAGHKLQQSTPLGSNHWMILGRYRASGFLHLGGKRSEIWGNGPVVPSSPHLDQLQVACMTPYYQDWLLTSTCIR